MRLNLSNILTIVWSELRMVVRNRRAVLVSIVLPIFLIPAMFAGSHWSIKKRETKLQQTTFRYALCGSQSNAVRELMLAAEKRLKLQTNAPSRFAEQPDPDPFAAVSKGNLEFVLECLTVPEFLRRETNLDFTLEEDRIPLHEIRPAVVPPMIIRLVFRGNRDESAVAAQEIKSALHETRNAQREQLLLAHGFPLTRDQVAIRSSVNVSNPGTVAGLSIGRGLTLFLLFFVISGGGMIAIDMLAGEKERGTLETLLTTSVGRTEIILAKHFVIMAVALAITLIQASCLLAMASFKLVPMPPGIAQALSPSIVLLLILLYIPVLALISDVLLLTSGHAKDYKEAHVWFLPVFLLGMLPALTPFLPGASLHSIIALIPIANIALAVKEILSGKFDWPMIAISWAITAGVAVWLTRLNVRFLCAERLVTAADTDAVEHHGGLALFERRVWIWFVVLWGALLIVDNYLVNLDVRLQISINLIGLFFGACVLMIRTYRLDIRSTLSLRKPRPLAWLAVLIGVPGGMLTGTGIMRLANYVIPVPPQMIESFGKAVAPTDMPFYALILFLAVLPGVFEEITFRGLLLTGLRRRFSPAVVVLIVGLVFGLFHVALFRLAPTAFLGMLLACVTLLTGSIFPSVLWHALNNGLALAAFRWDIAISDMDSRYYLCGPVLLFCAFRILWSDRRK